VCGGARPEGPSPPAIGRTERDCRLTRADGAAYATAPRTLAAARVGDLEDTVELTFNVPTGADSAVLVFRNAQQPPQYRAAHDMMLGERRRPITRLGSATP